MKNRRRGPDFVIKLINWISGISWAILVAIFLFLIISNPTSKGMSVSRPSLKATSTAWMSNAIYAFLIFLIILSIAGIVFNMTRMKRKTDKMKLTFFFSGILAIIGLIIINIA
jgi:hypothetical protein